jgi:hypothetical protein
VLVLGVAAAMRAALVTVVNTTFALRSSHRRPWQKSINGFFQRPAPSWWQPMFKNTGPAPSQARSSSASKVSVMYPALA